MCHQVKESAVILIFLSKGYFVSRACKTEYEEACRLNKPIVLEHPVHHFITLHGPVPVVCTRLWGEYDSGNDIERATRVIRNLSSLRRMMALPLLALPQITPYTASSRTALIAASETTVAFEVKEEHLIWSENFAPQFAVVVGVLGHVSS